VSVSLRSTDGLRLTEPWESRRRSGQDQAEVVTSPTTMTPSNSTSQYALGYTNAEHDRLIRQAARLAPYTERVFREAGIGPGQRVLDLGSGVGDVAMLAARLVGPSGRVVGVERDSRSIAQARARVAEIGLQNISFTQSEVSEVFSDKLFDAAVGRCILMYLPDPAGVLRTLSRLVRPGGVLAFQEPSWVPVLALYAHLPLWSACASLILEAFQCAGANAEVGTALSGIFQQAGLPPPTMHMDVLLGHGQDPDFSQGIYGLLHSLRPQIERFGLKLESLGDFDTLPLRLQAELAASNGVAPWLGAPVAAWSRKPIG
jgi:SAM-dependent methyltransferase